MSLYPCVAFGLGGELDLVSGEREVCVLFFFASRRRHTRSDRDWSSDVCSSDLAPQPHHPSAFPPGHEPVRVELAYRALVHGQAETRTDDAVAALERSYEAGLTDEFVRPIVVTKGSAASAVPVGLIRDDDAVIFFNFRADRARQMTCALAAPDFDKFVDAQRPKNLFYVGITQYDKNWPWLKYVIAPEKLEHLLAQVFADVQYKNLRTAETEKYAHVTYFFNGGVEKAL